MHNFYQAHICSVNSYMTNHGGKEEIIVYSHMCDPFLILEEGAMLQKY